MKVLNSNFPYCRGVAVRYWRETPLRLLQQRTSCWSLSSLCHPKALWTSGHVEHAHQYARIQFCTEFHLGYLHDNILDYAEALTQTLPPECSHLTVCMFACTGSEANDLALRIARSYTGNEGFLISENAYHGSTFLTSQISPEVETENERGTRQ